MLAREMSLSSKVDIYFNKITDEEISNFDRIKRGLDWGYAQDPFAYIVMHYDKTRKNNMGTRNFTSS